MLRRARNWVSSELFRAQSAYSRDFASSIGEFYFPFSREHSRIVYWQQTSLIAPASSSRLSPSSPNLCRRFSLSISRVFYFHAKGRRSIQLFTKNFLENNKIIKANLSEATNLLRKTVAIKNNYTMRASGGKVFVAIKRNFFCFRSREYFIIN